MRSPHVARLVRWAGNVALAMALLVLLGVGIGPRTGAYQTMTVLSGSMGPSMPAGAMTIVRPKPIEQVRVGDVLVYRIPVDDQRVVSHRVVEIVESGARPVVRTKGDANAEADRWTAQLRGDRAYTVVLSIPRLGLILQGLRAPLFRAVLGMAVPLAFVLVALTAIWRGSRRVPRAAASTGSATRTGASQTTV